MILKIEKKEKKHPFTSKLGKKCWKKATRTIYHIECDACGRKLTRSKGEAYKIEEREKHACSPECVAKISVDSRKEKYVPRRARRKSGYVYIGKKREHQIVAEKMLGRPIKKGEIIHHINGDKGGNTEDNLYVCESIKEHNRIHGQLEGLSMLLVQRGEILFCKKCALYYLKSENCLCGSSFSV